MKKVAKDMSRVYHNTPTIELIKNKGRKQLELMRAEQQGGYFGRKEALRIKHMIMQIDAVLAARAAQQPLF